MTEPTRDPRTAAEAYAENTAAIQAAIQKLQAGLRRHGDEQQADSKSWAFAGDASYVLDLLHQAVTFLNTEED